MTIECYITIATSALRNSAFLSCLIRCRDNTRVDKLNKESR